MFHYTLNDKENKSINKVISCLMHCVCSRVCTCAEQKVKAPLSQQIELRIDAI